LGARVRDILLAAGGYTVSVELEVGPSGDVIIPIVAVGQDPLTVLTQLRASVPEAYLLPVLDEKHLSKALGRSLPKLTDFLVAPIRGPELLARIRRLLPLDVKAETERVRERLQESIALERLRGVDPAFQAVKQLILRVAKVDATVLLTGETGTGKELASHAIHYLSDRANKPFVPVNCGAIPAELFENELFGHHRGAFTDARSDQRGLVAEAEGGTLFLDEINALTLTAQVKLLRFLEDRSYRPLGFPRSIKADVRVLAATNTDLKQKVHEGTFREDLFYRLHVVTLGLPPLRDRIGDIPPLAEYFLERHATIHGRRRFTPEALEAICAYEWPGNVRELENLVLHLVVMKPPGLIRAADLPWPSRPAEVHSVDSFRASKARAMVGFERSYLAGVLQTHRGNITRAARAAGQDRRTFRRLVQKHRLDPSIWTAAP
jgi:DNA-binding NtrC family response regulator